MWYTHFMKITWTLLILFGLVGLPLMAEAQNIPTTITQITSYIQRTIVGWLTGIFWAITAVFMIWAAFLYLFGASDEDRVTKSKQTLIYAVIAGIVALFSTVGLRPILTSLFP